ncbi:helix-turn-helix domain-containing protein [Pseudoduganella buxea]|uniref:Helix-turn-helix domain-containing protein n=1 Tax=Pseudoduganella buxea TaxID=1949069 RepID=A0A6I3T1D0_9BURK|nr:helix-turn-helix domain-containing protein [Pseudoduganella buxea]MTV55410.1 helix-turn-helix domain-containing protein [Pseudoduganella buxea]GGC08363.1 transcriptional regulator [Pseudoduganella buxea]
MTPEPNPQLLLTASQLGQLLVSTRKRHKLTQAAVATRVGLSQNRISYLESHADEISVKQLLSWCSVLGLDLLLGERDTSTASTAAEW